MMYVIPYAYTLVGRNYPLVTDLSTYWFGLFSSRSSYYWTQVSLSSYSGNSGLTFSWQDILLGAGQSSCVSAIFKSGVYVADQPRLLVHSGSFPASVLISSSQMVSGYVNAGNSSWLHNILMVIDNDFCGMQRMASGVVANSLFVFNIEFSTLSISIGSHVFSFYAVDDAGCVSQPGQFTLTIRSPTRSASPPPSATPVPTISIAYTLNPSYFNVYGVAGSTNIQTARQGRYYTRMRILSSLSDVPGTYNGVNFVTGITRLSGNALVLAFRITNHNSSAQVFDFECDADVDFDGNDDAPLASIYDNRGFLMYSSQRVFSILTRDYPIVRDVSTYWFGSDNNRSSHYWTQVSAASWTSGDSACSFSWQNILISPGRSITLSVIMKFGGYLPTGPILTMSNSMIPDQVGMDELVAITGSVSDSNSDVNISIFLVINDDCFELKNIQSSLSPGSFVFPMSIGSLSVPEGFYGLSFYAVDSIGCVSPGVHFNVTITRPTATMSPFRTATVARSTVAFSCSSTFFASAGPRPTNMIPRSSVPTASISLRRSQPFVRSAGFAAHESVVVFPSIEIEPSGDLCFSADFTASLMHGQTFAGRVEPSGDLCFSAGFTASLTHGQTFAGRVMSSTTIVRSNFVSHSESFSSLQTLSLSAVSSPSLHFSLSPGPSTLPYILISMNLRQSSQFSATESQQLWSANGTPQEQGSVPADHPGGRAGEGSSGFPLPIVAGVGGGVVVLAAVSWTVYRIRKGHGPSVQVDEDERQDEDKGQPEIELDDALDETITTGAGLETYMADDFTVSSKSRTNLGSDIFGVSDGDIDD
jgi:hypothetical protein